MLYQSFETKLKLNNQQKTILVKHPAVPRHIYKWEL